MPSILIIGGGLAGLFAALKLSPHPCTLLTPAPLGEGASSAWAQGGIAAAIGEGDSVDSHVADTLLAGAGLCDEAMVRLMAEEASGRILDLLEFGVPFDRDLAGKLVQSREAAHSAHRIVRVKGDQAGKAIMEALGIAARAAPSIHIVEGAEATDLIVEDGVVKGAKVRLRGSDGALAQAEYRADATLLATGGIGQLYAVTTNPGESRGTGLAMAARAGAKVMNAEFVQFHPTAMDVGRDPAPLATEALRGEGATLINAAGERFMVPLHKDAELAPRDVVARGVFAELVAGRRPMLDATTAVGAHFPEKFPSVYAACRDAGINPVKEPIPVTPAEHYHMGGVASDADGRTTLPGLFAVGEVACTGVHGANRLASNSLLEAVVFAARAAEAIKARPAAEAIKVLPAAEAIKVLPAAEAIKVLPAAEAEVEVSSLRPVAEDADESGEIATLRGLMARHLGVVREAAGLRQALREFQALYRGARSRGLADMSIIAGLIAESALRRRESRGGHYRTDYPLPDPASQPGVALTPDALANFRTDD
jgi:L-aspartate oxidase